MGLTIHYQLATTGDQAHARKLIPQLHQAALALPFQHVAKLSSFRATSATGAKASPAIAAYPNF